MKKKLLALFLVAAMIFGLTACGKTSSQTGTTADNGTTAASEDGTTADAQTDPAKVEGCDFNIASLKGSTSIGLVKLFPIRMRETPLISTITPSTEPLTR